MPPIIPLLLCVGCFCNPFAQCANVAIPSNSHVERYIELYQGRWREAIQQGLERGSAYVPFIQEVFRAEGLPVELAFVPLIESSFRPNAVSPAKAKGVWQLMKTTAKENGLRCDHKLDERLNPVRSTIAAARYLKVLSQMFNSDWHLVLAAYNAGPERVRRDLERYKAADFWYLYRRGKLPKETREYVPKVLAAILVGRNPAQYGLALLEARPIWGEIDR